MKIKSTAACAVIILLLGCPPASRPARRITVTFKGIIQKGQIYSQPFGRIFRFELKPTGRGWVVQITKNVDHVQVTCLPLKKERTVSGKTVSDPTRELTFYPGPEGSVENGADRGTCVFRIQNYGTEKDDPAVLTWMQFEAVVTRPPWNR